MPDEEMEIIMDLAHPGSVEDIDIDLDFAQADEDMELADFETFNSDGRDELMGDGDDESYGMIDADNIAHNAAAAAANDIEIDIGGSDEHLLPGTTAFGVSHQVDEIDYAPNLNIGEQNLQSGDWFQTTTEQVSGTVDTAQVESAGDVGAAVAVVATSADETMALPTETTTLPMEATNFPPADKTEVTDDFEPSESYIQDAPILDNLRSTEHDHAVISNLVEETATSAEADKDDSGVDHNEAHNDVPSTDRQPVEEADATEPVEQVQLKPDDEDDPLVGGDLEAQVVEYSESTADPKAETNQPGDYLYGDNADDGVYAKEGDVDTKVSDPQDEAEAPDHHSGDQNEHSAHELAEEDCARGATTEDAASIAARLEMYISYGQTDYRLFARGEDDDPNQYFLKDTAALELSLAGFLTSLREVISEEVSPLDELALHVDGLGLEFAESTTSDFLDGFTFGDILKLYDGLVNNDQVEAPPDLYCYLMVRPNCSQRLMALLDSAKSGRGLSEIAVYRESSPFDEGQRSAPGSPALSDSIDNEAADIENEHDDNEADAEAHTEAHTEEKDFGAVETHEDPDIDEHTNTQNDVEADPVIAADATTVETTEPTETSVDHLTESGEGAATDGQKPEDDLLDFSDDELDVSPSKQDDLVDESSNGQEAVAEEIPTGLDKAVSNTANGHILPTTSNGLADAAGSEDTSATATLNGDDRDEIDYSDDEDDVRGGDAVTNAEDSREPASLKVPDDEEITWESENEEAKDETTASAPKGMVQVSSPHGKRTRAQSEEDEGEQNGVKRRRS